MLNRKHYNKDVYINLFIFIVFSPWNGGPFPIDQTIGGIVYDANNQIVGAKAFQVVYRIFSNETFNGDSGAIEDQRADAFENEVNKIGQRTYNSFQSVSWFSILTICEL